MNCELVYIGKSREIQCCLCESCKCTGLGLFFMCSNTVTRRSFTRIVKFVGVRACARACVDAIILQLLGVSTIGCSPTFVVFCKRCSLDQSGLSFLPCVAGGAAGSC